MNAPAPNVLAASIERQLYDYGYTNHKCRSAMDLKATYAKGVIDACCLLGITDAEFRGLVTMLVSAGRIDEALQVMAHRLVDAEQRLHDKGLTP